MFQACDVKMAKIETSSSPTTEPGKSPTKNEMVISKNPRIGTDCKMSRTGIKIMPARRLRAAAVP
jgi:hypothetical protein